MDGLPWEIIRPLTTSERSALEVRIASLELALEPYDDDDIPSIESDLAAMFNGFRSMRQQGADIGYTVEITRAVLRRNGFPAWAVQRACLKIASGGAGFDIRYAPNDSQIVIAVEREVERFRRTLNDARRIADAVCLR